MTSQASRLMLLMTVISWISPGGNRDRYGRFRACGTHPAARAGAGGGGSGGKGSSVAPVRPLVLRALHGDIALDRLGGALPPDGALGDDVAAAGSVPDLLPNPSPARGGRE